MSEKQGTLHSSWQQHIGAEFDKPYMRELKAYLQERKSAGATIFPDSKNWFNAFNSTHFDNVKVVIIGQDPYHGAGQAHGLCFSVQNGVKVPPSLVNIYKELKADLNMEIPSHGFLQSWADQGVLLLNSVLTVEEGQAGAHQNRGWEKFTDAAIDALNREREGLVFMLWGSYAQRKGGLINRKKHLVLESVHPSPLSAHRGFLGCAHFSKANEYLSSNGRSVIDWRLPK